jgi:hypothetical protein
MRLLERMGAKDWLIEKTALAVLNQSVLKPYGTLTRLKLDTSNHSIEAELDLKGETQPVRIQVQEYDLLDESGKSFFVIKIIQTSREWLTVLARDFAVGRKFEVPESVRSFLPMIS